MDLYFLRHGKAVNGDQWQGPDSTRPLTDEGRAETSAAARGLRQLGLRLDVIATSPFTRARETAELTAAGLGLSTSAIREIDALQSGFDIEDLPAMLRTLGPARAVMLVGHEPDFSTIIGRLIAKRSLAHVEIKKGACCRVQLDDDALRTAASPDALLGAGTLRWLLTARQLGMIGASAS